MQQLFTWLSHALLVWLSLDLLIIVVGWLAVAIIKPRWPDWWRQVVADEMQG